jgi:hypothetical protein
MFGLFKGNPSKKLRKQYDILLEKGMQAQRKGDIRLYAELTSQAESLWKEIEAIEKEQ